MKFKSIIFYFIFLLISLSACNNGNDKDTNPQSIRNNEIIETSSANDVSPSEGSAKSSNTILYILIAFVAILGPGLFFFFKIFIPLGLWYETWLSGIRVSWAVLIKMHFQKVPQELILKTLIEAKNAGLKLDANDLMVKYLADVDITVVSDTAIRATNAGIEINFNDLAAKYLAKVNVETVLHALITAKNADLNLTINQLASYYLANVDVIKVVEALITAHNAGYDEFTIDALKEHYLAGGDITKTVEAFIMAKKANLQEIHFPTIAAIDLSGIDVVSAVASAITPRVIETAGVSGIARDGIQLIMKLKLTVRADLNYIIGGAAEDTVMARVDESLSSEIGKALNHYDVLQNPFTLAENVEKKNLGTGTAFNILSIDVSDIKVGRDVQSELEIERAKAKTATARAELIRAEEKVQKAMAAAFLEGKLSINQYHEMMNTEADTMMRKNLGTSSHQNNENNNEEDHHH